VLLLGRFVSALRVWDPLDAALVVPAELGGVTGALDEEPPVVAVPEPDGAPLEEVVPELGDEPPFEAVPEPDEEPPVVAVPEPDDAPPAGVVPELGDALPVEGAAPELEAEPDPDVLTTVGVTPCVAPLLVAALLPPHAVITRKAAQIVGAAAQFLSDKSLFISVILRGEICPRIMLTSQIERSLSLCGDCLRSATVSIAK
jgi:hypothetical protein